MLVGLQHWPLVNQTGDMYILMQKLMLYFSLLVNASSQLFQTDCFSFLNLPLGLSWKRLSKYPPRRMPITAPGMPMPPETRHKHVMQSVFCCTGLVLNMSDNIKLYKNFNKLQLKSVQMLPNIFTELILQLNKYLILLTQVLVLVLHVTPWSLSKESFFCISRKELYQQLARLMWQHVILFIAFWGYIALFSALEQTHCTRMWFYMSE